MFLFIYLYQQVRFCASHTTPIHETLAKAKVSLLNVVKKIKFGAKITLTMTYVDMNNA